MFLTTQVVEIGNFYYFFYLCLFIILSVGLSLILRKASPKAQNNRNFINSLGQFRFAFSETVIPALFRIFPYFD